jgi:hypothetical protein
MCFRQRRLEPHDDIELPHVIFPFGETLWPWNTIIPPTSEATKITRPNKTRPTTTPSFVESKARLRIRWSSSAVIIVGSAAEAMCAATGFRMQTK